MPKTNAHRIWDLKATFDPVTGAKIKEGLIPLLGHGNALRELKKRCNNEVKHGSPLLGCTYYVNSITALVKKCLELRDSYVRSSAEEILLRAGERRFVTIIEQVWTAREESDLKGVPPTLREMVMDELDQYHEEIGGERQSFIELGKVPDNIVLYIIELIDATFESRYKGEIARKFEELTPRELEHSVNLAMSLTKAAKEVIDESEEAPAEEEPVEPEETAPEPEEESAPSSADAATTDAIDEAVRKAIE